MAEWFSSAIPDSSKDPARAQLQLPPRERSRAGGKRSGSATYRVCYRIDERPLRMGKAGCKSLAVGVNEAIDNRILIVDGRKIGPVKEVEGLGRDQQAVPLIDPEFLGQPHVQRKEVRSLAGIVAKTQRPVVGGVAVVVDIGSPRQYVERMPAVVFDDGRQLESREERILPWTVHHAGDHHFVALVKVGKAAFPSQIGL